MALAAALAVDFGGTTASDVIPKPEAKNHTPAKPNPQAPKSSTPIHPNTPGQSDP